MVRELFHTERFNFIFENSQCNEGINHNSCVPLTRERKGGNGRGGGGGGGNRDKE